MKLEDLNSYRVAPYGPRGLSADDRQHEKMVRKFLKRCGLKSDGLHTITGKFVPPWKKRKKGKQKRVVQCA